MACLVLLIPRLYLSQEYEHWTRVGDDVEPNYFVYAWKVLPYLPSRLSWLWFLGILFIAMVLNYPILAYSYRRKNRLPWESGKDGRLIAGQIVTLSVWAIPCATLVSLEDAHTYLLPSIVVLALFYSLMFSVQHFILRDYRWAMLAKLIGPVCCVLMNNFKYGSYDNNLYGLLLGLHYQSMFLA